VRRLNTRVSGNDEVMSASATDRIPIETGPTTRPIVKYIQATNLTSGGVVQARTIFVDGTNGDDGTAVVNQMSLPYATLNAAVTAASANDRIFILGGTYTLTGTLAMLTGMTIEGGGATNTVIICSGNSITMAGVNDVTIKDLTINAGSTAIGILGSADSYDIKIHNCEVHSATSRNIDLSRCSVISIVNCKIRDSTADGLYSLEGGIVPDDTKKRPPLVQGCHFYENGTHGINFIGVHDPVITGNNFEKNGNAGIRIQDPVQSTIVGNQLERNTENGTVGTAQIIVDLNDLTVYTGIYAVNRGNINISANGFGVGERGVLITGTANSLFEVCISSNLFLSPTNVNISFSDYRPAYGLSILANRFTVNNKTTQDAVVITGQATGVDGSDISILGNSITNYERGVVLTDVIDVSLSGNTIANCDTALRFGGTATESVDSVGNIFNGNTDLHTEGASATATYRGLSNIIDGVLQLVESNAVLTPTVNGEIGIDGSSNVLIRSAGVNKNISSIP